LIRLGSGFGARPQGTAQMQGQAAPSAQLKDCIGIALRDLMPRA